MGVRYRKRTKGKNGWVNVSYSEKHGLNTSVSVKSGPFTWNSGNGKTTKKRVTTNLPGGFYHVSSDSTPRRSRSEPRQPFMYVSTSEALSRGLANIVGFFVIFTAVFCLFTYPWWTAGFGLLCWLYYIGSKK